MYPGIDELHSFVVLAGELHFGRASKRLFVSQPALSRQIRKLEEKVGGPLFTRTRRKVEITEAGRVLLSGAKKVLQDAEAALSLAKDAAASRAGTLRIGFGIASVSELLPRTILRFSFAPSDFNVSAMGLSRSPGFVLIIAKSAALPVLDYSVF